MEEFTRLNDYAHYLRTHPREELQSPRMDEPLRRICITDGLANQIADWLDKLAWYQEDAKQRGGKMKKIEGLSHEKYEIGAVGYLRHNVLFFMPDAVQVGDIEDGVTLQLKEEGKWYISYEDLIEMARIATKVRIATTNL